MDELFLWPQRLGLVAFSDGGLEIFLAIKRHAESELRLEIGRSCASTDFSFVIAQSNSPRLKSNIASSYCSCKVMRHRHANNHSSSRKQRSHLMLSAFVIKPSNSQFFKPASNNFLLHKPLCLNLI